MVKQLSVWYVPIFVNNTIAIILNDSLSIGKTGSKHISVLFNLSGPTLSSVKE